MEKELKKKNIINFIEQELFIKKIIYDGYFYSKKNIKSYILWLLKNKWGISLKKIIRFVFITIGLRLGLVLFLFEIQNDLLQVLLSFFYVDYKPIFAVLSYYESWALADYLQLGIGTVQIVSIVFIVYFAELTMMYTYYRKNTKIILVKPLIVVHGLVFMDAMWFDSGILNKDLHPWLNMVRWTLENNVYIDEVSYYIMSVIFFIIGFVKECHLIVYVSLWLQSVGV